MFGLGFTEILFIAIIAIIFLGPDKLPEAMVQIAKFMNSFRKTVSDAKSSFESEINMNELKEQANTYRDTITGVTNDISGFKNSLSNPVDDLNNALKGLDDDSHMDDNLASKSDDIAEFTKEKKKKKPKAESTKTEPAKKKKKTKSEDEV